MQDAGPLVPQPDDNLLSRRWLVFLGMRTRADTVVNATLAKRARSANITSACVPTPSHRRAYKGKWSFSAVGRKISTLHMVNTAGAWFRERMEILVECGSVKPWSSSGSWVRKRLETCACILPCRLKQRDTHVHVLTYTLSIWSESKPGHH